MSSLKTIHHFIDIFTFSFSPCSCLDTTLLTISGILFNSKYQALWIITVFDTKWPFYIFFIKLKSEHEMLLYMCVCVFNDSRTTRAPQLFNYYKTFFFVCCASQNPALLDLVEMIPDTGSLLMDVLRRPKAPLFILLATICMCVFFCSARHRITQCKPRRILWPGSLCVAAELNLANGCGDWLLFGSDISRKEINMRDSNQGWLQSDKIHSFCLFMSLSDKTDWRSPLEFREYSLPTRLKLRDESYLIVISIL